jgi:hypothetical protein
LYLWKEDIFFRFYVVNIESEVVLQIGSSCIDHWDESLREKNLKRKCIYCGRRNGNELDCLNCKGKKNLKYCFHVWKTTFVLANRKIDFGKYKGILSYKDLRNKMHNNYIEFLISKDCNIPILKKEMIRNLVLVKNMF